MLSLVDDVMVEDSIFHRIEGSQFQCFHIKLCYVLLQWKIFINRVSLNVTPMVSWINLLTFLDFTPLRVYGLRLYGFPYPLPSIVVNIYCFALLYSDTHDFTSHSVFAFEVMRSCCYIKFVSRYRPAPFSMQHSLLKKTFKYNTPSKFFLQQARCFYPRVYWCKILTLSTIIEGVRSICQSRFWDHKVQHTTPTYMLLRRCPQYSDHVFSFIIIQC